MVLPARQGITRGGAVKIRLLSGKAEQRVPSIGLRPNVVYGETAATSLAMRAAAQGERCELPCSGHMCFG